MAPDPSTLPASSEVGDMTDRQIREMADYVEDTVGQRPKWCLSRGKTRRVPERLRTGASDHPFHCSDELLDRVDDDFLRHNADRIEEETGRRPTHLVTKGGRSRDIPPRRPVPGTPADDFRRAKDIIRCLPPGTAVVDDGRRAPVQRAPIDAEFAIIDEAPGAELVLDRMEPPMPSKEPCGRCLTWRTVGIGRPCGKCP